MMTRDEEIALVIAVLEHPAGFDLDFAGGCICIRTTGCGTIEVEWQTYAGQRIYFPTAGQPIETSGTNKTPSVPKITNNVKSFPIENKKEAANFFIDKRHELEIGLDYETVDNVS